MNRAEQLIAEGYRRVSRKYGTVSRLDRPDWYEYLLKKYPNWQNMPRYQVADYYLRVCSKDTIDLGRYWGSKKVVSPEQRKKARKQERQNRKKGRK